MRSIANRMKNTDEVTRLEIIDHTTCNHCGGTGRVQNGNDPTRYIECAACSGSGMPGRSVMFWDKNKQIELSLQDGGRTLKIFIEERSENATV